MEVTNIALRSKRTFISLDSLSSEEERLATFIDWPLGFVSPSVLAQEGFYYLRTKDHCACAFCRGIIGAWEKGDTPQSEHKKHFPQCPFVQGKVTPNIPLRQGRILSKVSLITSSRPAIANIDVCGTKPMSPQVGTPCAENRLLTKSESTNPSLSRLGFSQYCGPKRKDFLTSESRLLSFRNWPEKVKQDPKQLAEAGFYYCGLSDHVRCFHCGNGLRNWEPEDMPWEEHARWFPTCHFVVLKKGKEFVEKIREDNPPISPQLYEDCKPCFPSSSSSSFTSEEVLTEEELDVLMELSLVQHVREMGFSQSTTRAALREQVAQTGAPFTSLQSAVDAVLRQVEVETRAAVRGCEGVTAQARQLAKVINAGLSEEEDVPPPLPPPLPTVEEMNVENVEESEDIPPQRPQRRLPTTEASTPNDEMAAASIPTTSQAVAASSEQQNTSHSQRMQDSAEENNDATPSVEEIPEVITAADDTIEATDRLLNPTKEEEQCEEPVQQAATATSGVGKKDECLQEELDRLRERLLCCVCMDRQMDVVFLPCTHMVTCSSCTVALSACPICRTTIEYAIRPIVP